VLNVFVGKAHSGFEGERRLEARGGHGKGSGPILQGRSQYLSEVDPVNACPGRATTLPDGKKSRNLKVSR
jgi:hypothetical protein